MIEVKNLVKRFDDGFVVLNGISEKIEKGEKIVIIGPSGSGKSTFLRCLNLLETATSGEILFEGKNILDKKTDINGIRQKMGMVFQHFNLFPHLTVLQNITLAPVMLKKMTKDEADKKARELLDRIGLLDKADAYPSSLSGGQKQRIAVARALLKDAEILILDDATSALDLATEAALYEALGKMRPGLTKLIVAQRAASVRHADRILLLEEGCLAASGTHEELMASCEAYREIVSLQTGEEESA